MKLKGILKNKLSKKELEILPSSFDVIGDILIFSDFPKELVKKEKLIGNMLLKIHKHIKVVAKKTRKHSGVYRLKKIKIIAGEKRKITTHKENDVRLKLDVEKCYFSPRLGSERLRIAKLVKKNEDILVMFSGVGPYCLTIAKNSKFKEIYGIEINPVAHKYSVENLKLNKVVNIKLFKGDVKKVLPKIKKKFGRILMPLPKGAESFLDLAKSKIKKNGIIHFYDFSDEKDFPEKSISEIKKVFRRFRVLKKVKCGQYGPRRFRVCIDFKAF
jgi:tRNA (guanine37-N1)-methyltransferase